MRTLTLLLLTTLCVSHSFAQHSILIKNISIIDVEKGITRPNASVLIRDSMIEKIFYPAAAASTRPAAPSTPSASPSSTQPPAAAPSAHSARSAQSARLPSADTVIDGTGRYLIPGLWDMHTHVWSDMFIFPLLIANGVTGIRGMFEDVNASNGWKEKMAAGKLDGPDMRLAGPIVDGPNPVWPGSVAVKNAAEGRRAVDSLKNILHTDFIKVYSLLSRESYFAIAGEAQKQHIPFAGHVPNVVTVLEAAKAGQKSQEHLYGFVEAASDSADYLMQLAQGLKTDSTLKNTLVKKQFLLRTYNPRKLQQLLQELKQYDTWICPTLTVLHAIGVMEDTTQLSDPRMQYMSVFTRNMWDPTKDFRFKTWTPETFAAFRQEFVIKMQIVKAMQDAGIGLLAGTDFPNPYCYPGFGLHEELQWMVKAGLTPAQALRTATINPARYFDIERHTGSVAEGRLASLVILDADPLVDISNTEKINTVILRGKVFNNTALQDMLTKVKKLTGH
jgi:imidazolonepropionase-like amidohydrolase